MSMLVGRTPAPTEMLASGEPEDPARRNGEAYVVRFVRWPGGNALVFLGETGDATPYAVDDYLERYCGVGYLRDGGHIPERASVQVNGIGVAHVHASKERPRDLRPLV